MDLALIAGLLVVLLMGPGRISLDHLFGVERGDLRDARPASAQRREQTTSDERQEIS